MNEAGAGRGGGGGGGGLPLGLFPQDPRVDRWRLLPGYGGGGQSAHSSGWSVKLGNVGEGGHSGRWALQAAHEARLFFLENGGQVPFQSDAGRDVRLGG